MTSRQTYILLGVVLLGALVVRVGWGVARPADVDRGLPEEQQYLKLAKNFLAGNGMRFYDDRYHQDVVAFRMPGYPFFMALFDAEPRRVRLAQAALDTSTVLAVFLMARKWLGAGPSLLAGAAVALNPLLIFFCGLLLPETLFTAMLAWGMALLVLRPNYLWGAMVLAVSVLVRPSAVALPVVMGICAAFLHYKPGDVTLRRRAWLRLPVGTTTLLLVLLVLLPWALRNRTMLNEWVWLTTGGGVMRYGGFNADATGASDEAFVTSPSMRHLRRMSEIERDGYLSDLAGQWVSRTWKEDPARLVRLTAAKLARMWGPISVSEERGSRRGYRAAGWIYLILLHALVVLGLWRSAAVPGAGKLLLIAPAAYFTLIQVMSMGSMRCRIPVEPPLAVLAAAGLVVAWTRVAGMAAAPPWRRGVNDRGVGIVRE